MLWPKKNSNMDFYNEKIPATRKFPTPPPHNFSNDPLLNVSGSEKIVIYFILQTKFAA